MAGERRYGGEPRPLPPVDEQAAAELQDRINRQRQAFADYDRHNDAAIEGIAERWAAGGPSPAADEFRQARADRDAARRGDIPTGLADGQVVQAPGAPPIDAAYVQRFAQMSTELRDRQAQGRLGREIMNASPGEAVGRLSGLTHQQYTALNPAFDGRHPGDTQPIAGPGRYPGDTGPRGQAGPNDRLGAGPQTGPRPQLYPGGPYADGGPQNGAAAQQQPGGPQHGQQAKPDGQGARSGFRMPFRKADRSTGRQGGRST